MAKAEYKMSPNEAMILKIEGVIHGGGVMSNFSNDLMLTSQNLVVLVKGTFGGVKSIKTFPVNQIKSFNNQAQAILTKTNGGYPQVEVFFMNGQQENFGLQSKKDATNLISKINQLVTGEDVEVDVATRSAIPGTEIIADALGGTVDAFKGAFGFKSKKSSDSDEKVAGKCSFCGAAITGKKGQVTRCPYCDAEQQL